MVLRWAGREIGKFLEGVYNVILKEVTGYKGDVGLATAIGKSIERYMYGRSRPKRKFVKHYSRFRRNKFRYKKRKQKSKPFKAADERIGIAKFERWK
jgi:hypothetical protein